MVDYRREPEELKSGFEPIQGPARWYRFELTAPRIALIYFIVATGALYFSDLILPSIFADPRLAWLQAIKGFLEVLLTTLLIFGLTWNSRKHLLRKNMELETSRRELGVLHRILRHNLRNDLTVMRGYADLVKSEVTSSELKNHCNIIKQTCGEFTGSIEKAKYLSDLHSLNDQSYSVDVAELVDRIETNLQSKYPDANVEMVCHTSTEISVVKHFDFAIQELISNAIEHTTSEEPKVVVTAEVPPEDRDIVKITVQDNGSGIPKGEIDALRQWDETQLVHGSGVGLWVAQLIILKSGGTFEIENTEQGCRISILIKKE